MNIQKRLGRRYVLDVRDQQYPMRQCFREQKRLPIRRYWRDDFWTGDQGDKPHCVGYAWVGWLEAGPVRPQTDESPCINPSDVYHQAQRNDEWPGTNYDGTSVRAGAKILQRMGFIERYYWANHVRDIVRAVLLVGPVVVGTLWYSRMTNPKNGRMMRARGVKQGGHAYLISGVDRKRRVFRVRNSWGPHWGIGGRAFLPINDMRKLLRAQGEACLATEIPKEI